MNNIISREEPLFRKCCCFIPLRLCLQTWACIKLIADILAFSYLVIVIAILNSYGYNGFFKELSIIHSLTLLVVVLLVDIGFLIALTVGIFKKSFAILRVFYFYEFYAMVAETVILAVISVNVLMEVSVLECVIAVVVGVLYILLELCICLTVKSEMIKLRNKDQYDFSRMPACEADVEGNGKLKAEEE